MKLTSTIIAAALFFLLFAVCVSCGEKKNYSPLHNYTEYLIHKHNLNCQYEPGECPEPLCSHSELSAGKKVDTLMQGVYIISE